MNYCTLSKEEIRLNDTLITVPNAGDDDWLKAMYVHLKLNYSKFFKMDTLSKLTLLGVELLGVNIEFDQFHDQDIAILFANKNASTATDNLYMKSVGNNLPSPSLFVYTLPNICIGELAIYKKWFGSNAFLIADTIANLPLQNFIQIEFNKGAKACFIGWFEERNESVSASFIFLEKTPSEAQLKKIIDVCD